MHRIHQSGEDHYKNLIREDKQMKKGSLIVASVWILALMAGCDTIKDATDVTYTLDYQHVYTIQDNLTAYPYDIDLNDNSDYQTYKNKIRDIEIQYLIYSITTNVGGAGSCDFYANSYGNGFATATKIAETITFAAGENRGATYVNWINNGNHYLENLVLNGNGKLSVWAVGTGNVHITVPVELRIKLTANVLE
jgi:hypothetical protein